MPVPKVNTAAPARASARKPLSPLAAFAKETAALIKKTDGRDRLTSLCDTALMLKYQGSMPKAAATVLKLVRTASPAQAEVLHELLHRRLEGGTYRPPAAFAALGRQVTPLLANLSGDDLRGLRSFALQQQYRDTLSPAGAALLDGLRKGNPGQIEILYTQLRDRVHGPPTPGRYPSQPDS